MEVNVAIPHLWLRKYHHFAHPQAKFGTTGEVSNALKLGALDKKNFHEIDLAVGCPPTVHQALFDACPVDG